MNMRYLVVFSLCLLTLKNAVAEPYTFTEKDFIQYGIYFTAPRARTSEKLLEVKYGDIKGWYKAIAPQVSDKDIPATSQLLKVKTAQGSIRVNRRGNAGVTIVRDTHNEAKRVGTKGSNVPVQGNARAHYEGARQERDSRVARAQYYDDNGIKLYISFSEKRRLETT